MPASFDYGPVRTLLARTRRRLLLAAVGTGVCAGFAAVVAVGLAGATVLGAVSPHTAEELGWVSALAIALGALAVLVALAAFVVRPLFAWRSDVAVAKHLERSVPGTAGLTTAVQLHADLPDIEVASYSAELAAAHIARVAAAARGVDPTPAVPVRPLGRAAAAAGIAATLHLFALVLWGPTLRAGYERLLGEGLGIAQLDPTRLAGVPELITGDVELTYRFPGYTRLPPRTVSGTGGDIAALKGTEVEIRTTADRDVDAASMVVGTTALPLSVEGRRALSGRLVVNEAGTYRFRFTSPDGETLAEGASHRITVEPDAYPEVSAGYASGEVEGEREVREQDTVVVTWRAQDDFGLTEYALVYRVQGGSPQRLALGHAEERVREEGRHTWDLTTLHLAPGDRVAWYVEFVDNDAVSGPKKGVSQTRYLKVFSAAEHHRSLMEQVEKVWEGMLTSLADNLEAPFDVSGGDPASEVQPKVAAAEGLATQLDALLTSLVELIDSLADDPLAPKDMVDALTNVHGGLSSRTHRWSQNLRYFHSRLLARDTADRGYVQLVQRSRGDLVAELEKDILYLEDLLDRQKLRDLVEMAEELKAHRRRLADLVDQLRENPSEEVRAEISEEIARIKERIHELMRKMSELAKSIRDEFLNAEAMEKLRENSDLLGNLDEVQRLLNEGKLDEALERLQDMARMLEQMVESWQENEERFGSEEYQELFQEMSEFMDELQRVRRDQENLLEESGALREKYQKALEERVQGKLDDLAARLAKLATEAKDEVSGVDPQAVTESDQRMTEAAAERLQQTAMLLGARDFDEARATAKDALESLSNLGVSLGNQLHETRRHETLLGHRREGLEEAGRKAARAEEKTREISEELERLFPRPDEVFGREDARRMADQSRRQDQLRRRTAELQQRMQRIGQKAPIFSPGMEGQVRQAGRHMSEASRRLAESQAREAAGQQKAALDQLGQLQEKMQQASQGGKGMPMPMSMPSRGWGRGNPLNNDPVEIPDAEQYKPPEAFRQELLEAMKEGAPERYRPQVKQYYEELVR